MRKGRLDLSCENDGDEYKRTVEVSSRLIIRYYGQGSKKHLWLTEIDHLILTEHYLVPISVKYWGGSVDATQERDWVQKKSSGTIRSMKNPWRDLFNTTCSIKQLLRNAGQNLPDRVVVPMLVFSNDAMCLSNAESISPNILTLKPFVIQLRRLLHPEKETGEICLHTLEKLPVDRESTIDYAEEKSKTF